MARRVVRTLTWLAAACFASLLSGCASTGASSSAVSTPEAALECAPLVLPEVDVPSTPACDDDALTSFDGLLVLAPHPDDEVLGFGGLASAYLAQGKPVEVVVVTDGDAYCEACQFWKNSSLSGPLCSAADLSNFATSGVDSFAEIRRTESAEAARIFGYDGPKFFGYPDTGLSAAWRNTQDGHADARLFRSDFSDCGDCAICAGYGAGEETELTASKLITSLRGRMAATSERTLIATTHWLDNHGDHAALGRFVRTLNDGLDVPRTLAFAVIHADTSKEFPAPECWFPGPATPDCACLSEACALADPERVATLSNFRLRPEWPATVPDDAPYEAETDPARHLCLSEDLYQNGAKKLQAIRAFGSQLGTLARDGHHPPALDGLIDCSGYMVAFTRSTEVFYLRPPRREARSALADDIRDEILHTWKAYETYAWGHDDLAPLSKTPKDWYAESLLMTPVDALDTLLLAGLDDEADKARQLIVSELSFDRDVSVQVFEVTIRLLGGLLSSFQMTGDERLLALAEDLGTRLLPAFDSPTGMPYRFVHLQTGAVDDKINNPAEIGTLILEFGTLSRLTGRPEFFDRAKAALVAVFERRSELGLVGERLDVETGEWTHTNSHVGARIDSFFEYLLKCERLFGDEDCGAMWRESAAAMHRYLADDSPDGLWYGEADMETGERTATEYGALHAFLPGLLALDGDLERAARLQESGFRMWNLHGIEPELIDYSTLEVLYAGYQLRPEIAESAYVLYRLTGDERYREMGRKIFDDLKRHCRTDAGYAVLESVITKQQTDRLHSFFLAETLKYLYLLFAPDALDFEGVVFNTEAHPLRPVESGSLGSAPAPPPAEKWR